MSSPLLHVPRRKTDEIDLIEPFRSYIQDALCEDPDKYDNEIRQLNRYRQDAQGAGKDMTGRDILYRYYGQLEMLDLRFQFGEQHLKILFSWYDAFSGKSCGQYSPAFEKASIIFNLGSVCSGIAALQNRADLSGLKVAYNYFQAAAGMYQFINDNFLHAPSVDMSRDSIKVLVDLMLSQAQECFLEKVLSERKKGLLVSKLASHLSSTYCSILDGLSNPALKGQFDKTWIELAKIKGNYFYALACMHKSEHSENEGQYGESVAYILLAHQKATEAKSLADSFAKMFPYFTVSMEVGTSTSLEKDKSTDAAALITMTTVLLHTIEARKVVAVRDNDMIYHQNVPDTQSLPNIEKLNAVKAIPFADLLPNGQADIPAIVGPDLFKNMVPLSVTESSSLYSEEKAKVLRNQSDLVDEANQNLDITLESMDVSKTVNKVKAFIKSKTNDAMLPEEVRLIWNEVSTQEKSDQSLDGAKDRITSEKTKIASILNEVSLSLDQEQHECENLRVKYLDSWSQEPSASVNDGFRKAISQHRHSLDEASITDREVFVRISALAPFIRLFTGSLSEVSAYFAGQIVKNQINVSGNHDQSLLDEIPESGDKLGSLGEQIILEKIDALLQRLQSLKTERVNLLGQLRKMIQDDDISSLLLFHRGKESQVFQAELSKFTPLETQLGANVNTQTSLLDDLKAEFDRLKSSSTALKTMVVRESRRNSFIQEWQTNYRIWISVRRAIDEALEFHTKLLSAVTSLQSEVRSFVTNRKQERSKLVERIQKEHDEKGQEALREQLRRLSVQNTTPTTSLSPPSVSPANSHPPSITAPLSSISHLPSPLTNISNPYTPQTNVSSSPAGQATIPSSPTAYQPHPSLPSASGSYLPHTQQYPANRFPSAQYGINPSDALSRPPAGHISSYQPTGISQSTMPVQNQFVNSSPQFLPSQQLPPHHPTTHPPVTAPSVQGMVHLPPPVPAPPSTSHAYRPPGVVSQTNFAVPIGLPPQPQIQAGGTYSLPPPRPPASSANPGIFGHSSSPSPSLGSASAITQPSYNVPPANPGQHTPSTATSSWPPYYQQPVAQQLQPTLPQQPPYHQATQLAPSMAPPQQSGYSHSLPPQQQQHYQYQQQAGQQNGFPHGISQSQAQSQSASGFQQSYYPHTSQSYSNPSTQSLQGQSVPTPVAYPYPNQPYQHPPPRPPQNSLLD